MIDYPTVYLLTFQLLEMEIPVILNLNMMDVAHNRGVDIDVDKLAQRLGIRVVPTVMTTGSGKKNLLDAIATVAAAKGLVQAVRVDYQKMEPFLRKIESRLAAESAR